VTFDSADKRKLPKNELHDLKAILHQSKGILINEASRNSLIQAVPDLHDVKNVTLCD